MEVWTVRSNREDSARRWFLDGGKERGFYVGELNKNMLVLSTHCEHVDLCLDDKTNPMEYLISYLRVSPTRA